MSDVPVQLLYQTFQQGKILFGLAHKTLSTQLLNLVAPPLTELQPQSLGLELLQQIRERLDQMIKADWQDAQQGIYPVALLFDTPWADTFRYYPELWVDMWKGRDRANRKRYQEFSPEIDTSGYPAYYLQNFHHQTDGYLSDRSASLYDLQVDILFNGAADAMRRRILAPLKAGLQTFTDVLPRQRRVLDVACGTGRTLRGLRATFPQASLYGTDLSPAYLRKANELLTEMPGELPQLAQANAEELPYRDRYFHGVSCVFLFHELPPAARQRVIDDCFRVLEPGGTFVICDSVQAIDAPELVPAMENFSNIFHEPYYRHYMTDDLVERLHTAGFQDISTQQHFMSKYWIARKPAA